MQLFIDKKECSGCSACFSYCTRNAITMQTDEEGFLYPVIDDSLCVNCGLCLKVCGFKKSIGKDNLGPPINQYGIKHKDDTIRKNSTSGGAFSLLANYINKKNGVIYGAQYDSHYNVIHSREENGDYYRYMGSKYSQSVMGDTFSSVKKDLQNGKYVLFTGTPCQCDGLKTYISESKIDQSNLLLCDIVCHGTPSPKLFHEHIESIQKEGKVLVSYLCRSKDKGWHAHTEKAIYSDGSNECGSLNIQKQKEVFYSNLCLRPSCAICPYANLGRISDITIADFWGVENNYPNFDDNKGCSLVLTNSYKGENIIRSVLNECDYIEPKLGECMQPNLLNPSTVDENLRKKFWSDYKKKGYIYVAKKYTLFGRKNRLKKSVKNFFWIVNNFPYLIKRKLRK